MRNKTPNGFTLVELMTAIIVAVVLASAVYGTLSAGLNAKKKGTAIAEKNQTARAIIEQIQGDLLTASVSSTTPTWTFTATALADGSTYFDTVQFVATNQPMDWSVTGISDEAIIKYAIDTVPDTNSIGLIRTINRHVTDPESTDLSYQLISQDVLCLHFQYYSGTEWVTEWTDTSILPKAIMLTLAIRDTESPELLDWYTTTIRLPKA